jgi:hypothetical protein
MNTTPSDPPNNPSGKSRLGLISTIIGVGLYVLPIAGCILLFVAAGIIENSSNPGAGFPGGWFFQQNESTGGWVFLLGILFSSPIVGIIILIASTVGLALGISSFVHDPYRKGLPLAGIILNSIPFIASGCLVLLILFGFVNNISR